MIHHKQRIKNPCTGRKGAPDYEYAKCGILRSLFKPQRNIVLRKNILVFERFVAVSAEIAILIIGAAFLYRILIIYKQTHESKVILEITPPKNAEVSLEGTAKMFSLINELLGQKQAILKLLGVTNNVTLEIVMNIMNVLIY